MTRFQPQWLQSGSYAASVDRRLISALWPTAASTGGQVSATTGMALSAAPGQVAVPASNGTGSVLCSWDAPETVTLDPAPPSGTNRIDLVICQARSTDIGGAAGDDFIITFTKGAEAASPVAPAVPANAVALAQIAVTGGAAAIVAGNITDRRPSGLAANPPADDSGRLALPFGPNWGNFGSGFVLPYYRRKNGIVRLGGLARATAAVPTGSATVCTLPVGYRSDGGRVFSQQANIGAGGQGQRVDVQSDGTVLYGGAALGAGAWLSLDGISFDLP